MVRLKVQGIASDAMLAAYFNSKMVRLKGMLLNMLFTFLIDFNSKMVRLKDASCNKQQ